MANGLQLGDVPPLPAGFRLEESASVPTQPPGFRLQTPAIAPATLQTPQGTLPPPAAAEPRVAGAPPGAPPSGGFLASVGRGKNRTDIAINTTLYMLGLRDLDSFVESTTRNEAEMAQYPESAEEIAARKRWEEAEGLGISKLTPRMLANYVGETVPGLVLPIAGGLVGAVGGGLVGGPLGAGVGAAIGGMSGDAMSEYGSSFMDYLRKKGFDPSSEQSLRLAAADPNLVNDAHYVAALRAGAVAAFDAIGMKLGGSVAARFFFPGSSVSRKAVEIGRA